MALFLSTFEKPIDKKARVSVPPQFRAALGNQEFKGIVAYPSFINPAVEASGYDRILQLSESIETFDPFSEERDAFATAILAECQLNVGGRRRRRGGRFRSVSNRRLQPLRPSKLAQPCKIRPSRCHCVEPLANVVGEAAVRS